MMKRKSRSRLRLLPLVTIAIGALGLVKILALVLVGGYMLQPVVPAIAQEAGVAPGVPGAPGDPNAAGDPQAGAGPSAKSAEDIDGRLITLPDRAGGLSKAETAVLESLRKRREALDARERSLEMQTNLLTVAEQRIDKKINEIKKLQSKIDASLKQRDAADNKQLAGLVTMYENMKPKEAARIFNGLELPVLLGVAQRINPRKMSPILAKMDARMAQTLTVKIAGLNADQKRRTRAVAANGELEAVSPGAN